MLNFFVVILHSNAEYLNTMKTKISEFSLKALEILALQPLQPFFSKYLRFASLCVFYEDREIDSSTALGVLRLSSACTSFQPFFL